MAVLVVASQFPSINQPWMDVYLSQLLRFGHEAEVLSANREPAPYAEKVKRFSLPNRVRLLPLTKGEKVASILAMSTVHPLLAVRTVRAALALFSGEPTLLARVTTAANALAAAWPACRGTTPQLVHIHSIKDGVLQVPLAIARGIPLVVTFHGLEPAGVQQITLARARALFSKAIVVLVNTHFAAAQVRALGCPSPPIRVLPQGLPLEEFPYSPQPLPGDGAPLRLLSVGRFHRDKGQRYSLLAAARLLRSGLRFHWDIVGVGPDLVALKKLSTMLGLSDVVSFHVGVSRDLLKSIYCQAHIFVLASLGGNDLSEHVETQGVVLQEAQASGCIPVASAIGGIPECIEHGINGFLIPDRSHRAIASAIMEVISDEARYKTMQMAARNLVETRFSAAVVGREMSTLLLEVADQGKA
jgi:glycosyltransferase involved in cell wall biosynthesis